MGKGIGIAFLFIGIVGYLKNWIQEQTIRQKRIENFILFLQKSVFSIETENVKWIPYFRHYPSKDKVLTDTLQDIADKLEQNIFAKGQDAWEEVFLEKEQNWGLEHEIFTVMLGAGNGFFGRSREENICFLNKTIKELEIQENKMREKDAKERKVWIPVGMLSGIMLVIIFI